MENESINFLTTSGEIYHRKGIWKILPLWMFSLFIKFRKPDEVHEYKQPEFIFTVTETRNDSK
jgi:hypothetical protein